MKLVCPECNKIDAIPRLYSCIPANQSRETSGMHSIFLVGTFLSVTALVLAFLVVLERMIG